MLSFVRFRMFSIQALPAVSLVLLTLCIALSLQVARAAAPEGAEKAPAAANTWAHIELKGSHPEGPQMLGLFGEASENLAELIGRLDKAATDAAIVGVVLKIDGPTIGSGKRNEFQQAIARVKARGKKVVAFFESANSGDYLVAAGCDEVVMPESGVLMLLGLRSEVSFYKNLFDMVGVKPDMLRVGEFKSAAEPYSRTEMSKEFREELEQVLGDFYDQIVEAVAQGRKLDPEKVKAAIDNGPHTASGPIVISDTLPSGLAFSSYTAPAGWTSPRPRAVRRKP